MSAIVASRASSPKCGPGSVNVGTMPTVARRTDALAELIEQSEELEGGAQGVQGERTVAASAEQIQNLRTRYQEWLAAALNAVPDEFNQRLRLEYEGSWFSKKIKAFLEAPDAVSVLYRSGGGEVDTQIVPFWQYPFETSFHNPLIAQRQILHEARQQLLGAGYSEDLALVERICRGFGEFVRTLQDRRRGRLPLVVEDEYDVQDVLHGLLRIFFADVRPEDVSPHRAGAASRIDFILRVERIAVEAKMMRPGLSVKRVSEELIVDITRYQAHPDCDALVALIYDPNRRITNPTALEHDLSGEHTGIAVLVAVVP